MVAEEHVLFDCHQAPIRKKSSYKDPKPIKRTDKVLELQWKNHQQLTQQRQALQPHFIVNEQTPIKGFFGTVPWRWDQLNQRLIFESGEFPITYEYSNIRLQIQELSDLKDSPIKIISFTKPVKIHEESSYLFAQLHNLEKIENAACLDCSNAMNMSYLFYGCQQLKYVDVSQWNLSKVVDIQGLFLGATNLCQLDVSRWDTGQVVNMCSVFENMENLTYLDVSQWDVSNVWYTDKLFFKTSQLINLDVAHWNTGKIYTMNYMFAYASNLTNLEVSQWDVSNVRYMTNLFLGAEKLLGLDISNWNMEKVVETTDGFYKRQPAVSPCVTNQNVLSIKHLVTKKEKISPVSETEGQKIAVINHRSSESNKHMINNDGGMAEMYLEGGKEMAMVSDDITTVVAEFTAAQENDFMRTNTNPFADKKGTTFLNDFYLEIDEYITGEVNDRKHAKKIQLIINDTPTSVALVSATGSFELDPNKGKLTNKNDQAMVIVLDRKGVELERLVVIIEEKGYVLNVSTYKLYEQKEIVGSADYFQTHVSLKINDEEIDHQLLTGTREFIFDVSNQIEYEDDIVEVIGYSYGKEVTRHRVVIQKPSVELQTSTYRVGDLYLTGQVIGPLAKKLRLYVNMRRKQELSLSGDGSFSLLGIAIVSPTDKVEIAVLDDMSTEIQRFIIEIAS